MIYFIFDGLCFLFLILLLTHMHAHHSALTHSTQNTLYLITFYKINKMHSEALAASIKLTA